MMFRYKQRRDYYYNIKKPSGGVLHTDIMLVGHVLNSMKKGFSPIIMIVGKQRMGKSTFAVWLGNKIVHFFHNKPFDPTRNTFYDPLKVVRGLEQIQKEALVVDEAANVINAKEWYSKMSIALEKIIATQGYLSNCYIIVSPFSSDIAKAFRKHFDYLVFVRRRGVAVVKEIPKKYDDLKGTVPKPFSIEQIKFAKDCVPKPIWLEYEKFSKKEKEKIRKNTVLLEREFAEKDPFGRPILNA